ncbi:Protein of unknown function [Ferrimonas sediminum]|uniref:DUF1496 domain-containing protein n=1 Tax=Ferrimonas sediminum TaxID=718193 RepID=A0A1G8JTY2_9GAMM|nr:DUF1496 domain-containing protein [Ferrimonas sediminum]SDI34557.1 Protein of unknown function [Ferrimonas sediminum]
MPAILLLLSLFSPIAMAVTDPVLITQPTQIQPVCWYQGHQYSQGALLEMSGRTLVCAQKTEHETNGSLIWLPLDEQGRPLWPEPVRHSKIRIN